VPLGDGSREFRWAQEFYFAKLGKLVIDDLSSADGETLEEVEPEEYYSRVGHDGKGLRVPADLDDSICLSFRLSPADRERFDRATFWADMAARQWHISVSASFAALVSAIESLTQRSDPHHFTCPICGETTNHETPGAGRRFKDFLDDYAGGPALASRRSKMYSLRSGILHGSKLMQLDLDLAFGWDPPWWDENELHSELWTLTQIALRNWLRRSRKACSTG